MVYAVGMATATGSFRVTSWDEQPYHEGAAGKLTLAVVGQAVSGGVSGSGEARWLMAYRGDGTARFLGFQRVEGEFQGRRGAFVLETVGEFDGTRATWTATVVEGAGEGDLAGLRGSGRFGAPHGSEASYELDLTV
jgi:hypothetical protein